MPRLFQKPKLEPKEYLANLRKEILESEIRLDDLSERYGRESMAFLSQFSSLKTQKQKELDEMDSALQIKRSEWDQLNKPIQDRRIELDAWETRLVEREKASADEMQRAFEKERQAEHKLEDVQDLSDQLGEVRIRQEVKERLLVGRETGLKDRETAHMVKVERFSHEVNEASARIQDRENALFIRESTVQGKNENLVEREKKLEQGWTLLHDREGVLKRSWDELKRKQHVRTKRT